MTEAADAFSNESMRGFPRWRRLAVGAAVLVVGGALVCWWLYDRHMMVADFRQAMQQSDAARLVHLARISDRREVLEQAKTIWRLAATPETELTGDPLSGPLVVCTLPATTLEWLLGHRDLLVLPVDRESGFGIDVFYFRFRAGGLKVGADPRKFDRLEELAQRLLGEPHRGDTAGK